MKVKLDLERCEGQGICAGLAPAVFDLPDDADQVSIVDDAISPEIEKRVIRAVEKCPMAALSIEETN